jgi:hypothetical protein
MILPYPLLHVRLKKAQGRSQSSLMQESYTEIMVSDGLNGTPAQARL